ncbi:glycosyltransferase family protein [Pedobacter caeni]|uniref:Phosphatidylinositol glycan, class B n=1 Tax=Pedobacter caeni TaxID=288992 RepID=A0A1M5C1A8_9SPHI|nr:hypothetical protein [Pedobacter caeni]SHF48450.1 phosphatidylinositol glycan, class B [Pedobacter caeni]
MTKFKIENSGYFLVIVVIVYMIVAWNSTGYHHWDEHFQIIEFAGFKAGKVQVSELAWEYNAQIRSALQPSLCFLLFKGMYAIGIESPYLIAFLLRLISAGCAIWVINRFVETQRPFLSKNLFPYFIFLSYFLWFLPYINVRFSSESWSGLCFLMSLTQVFKVSDQRTLNWLLFLGAALGLSILFRFQSALLVFGVLIWLIVVARLNYREMLVLFGCILVVLLLGIGVDSWFYGSPSFTLYNYFEANILQDIASSFGTAPWYQYFIYIFKAPGIFGLFIILSLLIIVLKNPRHICLWALFPFLLVHAVIPHKELRFLFPLANLVPLFVVLGYQYVSTSLPKSNALALAVGLFVIFCYNLCGLVAISCRGAGLAKVELTAYIYRHYGKQEVQLIYPEGANPYQDITPQNTFYRHGSVSLLALRNLDDLKGLERKKQQGKVLLVIPAENINKPALGRLLEREHMHFRYQTFRPFVQQILRFYDQTLNEANLILYESE